MFTTELMQLTTIPPRKFVKFRMYYWPSWCWEQWKILVQLRAGTLAARGMHGLSGITCNKRCITGKAWKSEWSVHGRICRAREFQGIGGELVAPNSDWQLKNREKQLKSPEFSAQGIDWKAENFPNSSIAIISCLLHPKADTAKEINFASFRNTIDYIYIKSFSITMSFKIFSKTFLGMFYSWCFHFSWYCKWNISHSHYNLLLL